MTIVVVREPWRFDPLAWIHRAEARAMARELRAPLIEYTGALPPGLVLLRLSDAFMRRVVGELDTPYRGPGREALERCYDKYGAHLLVSAAGLDSPEMVLADSPGLPPALFVLKPRRGSDSIGVRIARAVPEGMRNPDHLVQARVVGREVTVALFRDQVGLPLEIQVPPGKPYSFLRKYLLRPGRAPFADETLREVARRIGQVLGVDWAARVDFIVEAGTGRAWFLECDAAPLVGAESAFAASFAAASVDRRRQLEWLVGANQTRCRLCA
jgi:D-alanine-D-alanine ligase-like ATP-grasp enzyme